MKKPRTPRSIARDSISRRLRSGDGLKKSKTPSTSPKKRTPLKIRGSPRTPLKGRKVASSCARVLAGRGRKETPRKRRRTITGSHASADKTDGKSSPIKTRLLLQKSKPLNLSRCTLCKNTSGELHACLQCHKLYHLQQCLLYPADMAHNAENNGWLCPRCILCAKCYLMIDDPSNVECTTCLRAWHGTCKPGGEYVEKRWYCRHCVNSSRSSATRIDGTPGKNSPFSTTSSPPIFNLGSAQNTPERRGRKKKVEKLLSISDSASASLRDPSNSARADSAMTILRERDDLNDALISADEHQREASRSPRRRTVSEKTLSHFLKEDAELFKQALEAEDSLLSVKEESEKQVKEQWINLGGGTDIRVLYPSPYPESIKSAPLFFVCPFCLKPISEEHSFFVHQDHCPRITPPGREIYRDDSASLSLFEVDGAVERTYCRNLCLFAMQFLSWKTRHNEIATFLFYVLTRNDEDGCRIVGYFSKEKNPSRNYNLSCLLTMPNEQRNGYGQLLIDMSYQLSKLERKVGGPERPLSDRGLFAYRRYWRSSILCYLRSTKDCHNISIKNMSLATRIHPTDIVNQLLHDNLLVMKDENYFFRTWKRAFKLPLSMLRRRVVDPEKIRWSPNFDVTTLDPFKLNYYV